MLLVQCAVILPMIVSTFLAVKQFRNNAESDFRTVAAQQMTQISQTFDIYLHNMANSVSFFAKLDAIRALDGNVASYTGPSKPMTPEENGEAEREAWRLMKAYGESNLDTSYVYLGLDNGSYIQWPTSDMGEYNPTTRPWFLAAKRSPGKPISTTPYADIITQAPLLPYMHSFTTESGLGGVFAIDITLSKLTDIVRAVTFGDSGYLILVDQTGVILADAANKEHNFKKISELSEEYQKVFDSDSMEASINGKDWLVSRYVSPNSDFRFFGLVPKAEVFAVANSFQQKSILAVVVIVVVFGLVGMWFSRLITLPINTMTQEMERVAQGEGDLTRKLPEEGNDELAQMAKAFNRFLNMTHGLVLEIIKTSEKVNEKAVDSVRIASDMTNSSKHQTDIMEQVATAFNEMVETATSVAQNSSETADAANQSQQHVHQGQKFIDSTVDAVASLTKGIDDSNHAMKELANESNNITTILDTIRNIAEQTNLLALNAAIEAARAGDQGRGFAVVADEVRTLAGRTATSTAEIDAMIVSLTERTTLVAEKLNNTLQHSNETKAATERTREVFVSIQNSVDHIRDITHSIASAAEEQHQVSEMINNNIVDVNTEMNETYSRANVVNDDAVELKKHAESLRAIVTRFRV